MKNILLFVTVTALFTTILGAHPGNHYAFAQEGAITPEGSVNDTMSGQNASQWSTNATLDIVNTTTSNKTLAFAQEGAITPEGSVNDTMSGQNASQWSTNATLAFAQEGFQTEDLVNETIDIGNTTTSNATLAFAQEGAITPEGSVNDTMSGQNASQWSTNATLAFVQ